MRYFFRISYDGTPFYGWQIQSQSSNTIQGNLESYLSKLVREEIQIVGCGRTDSGVHARDYIFHLDVAQELDAAVLKYKLNRMLPQEIVIHNIYLVSEELHARYSAISRSYTYMMSTTKDPFERLFSFTYPYRDTISLDRLNEASSILLQYSDFNTFCKTNHDANTTICDIESAVWTSPEEGKYVFTIKANRYLRGMIRLIVGMCLNVNRGKLTLEEVENCLANAQRLPLDWSVPASGLCLHSIVYPD